MKLEISKSVLAVFCLGFSQVNKPLSIIATSFPFSILGEMYETTPLQDLDDFNNKDI